MNRFFDVNTKIPKVLRCTVMILALVIGGCNTTPTSEHASALTTRQLLRDSPLLAPGLRIQIDEKDILALTPQMKDFVKQHVSATGSDHLKLRQLLQAMLDEGLMGIDYEGATRSAAQTFTSGTGNCLSFTNLFIALSRQIGLKVRYQEVDIPPDWDLEANMLILMRHINTEVTLHNSARRAVDFNIGDFKTSYPRRVISDERAKAHYYSNIAVEKMMDHEYQQALISIIKGVDIDQNFSSLWTNLGALYMRHGLLDYAEASFIKALKIDLNDYVALSNLERINRRLGRFELAKVYENRVKAHREKNPYYHYHLANNAFVEKNYSNVIDHLERAIKYKDDDDRFYFLMGVSYFKLNDELRGNQFLQQAKTLADNVQSGLYQSKIDRLFSHIH